MIQIFTCGGTIDKIYFDSLSAFAVGDSLMDHILKQAGVQAPYRITPLLQKDSLDMQARDRRVIRDAIANSDCQRILLTHGTDTMAETAEALELVDGKTIVLCGSMQPARMQETDAHFNIGAALTAAQLLDSGVYIVMNGQVFHAGHVRKNRDKKCFEVSD